MVLITQTEEAMLIIYLSKWQHLLMSVPNRSIQTRPQWVFFGKSFRCLRDKTICNSFNHHFSLISLPTLFQFDEILIKVLPVFLFQHVGCHVIHRGVTPRIFQYSQRVDKGSVFWNFGLRNFGIVVLGFWNFVYTTIIYKQCLLLFSFFFFFADWVLIEGF